MNNSDHDLLHEIGLYVNILYTICFRHYKNNNNNNNKNNNNDKFRLS